MRASLVIRQQRIPGTSEGRGLRRGDRMAYVDWMISTRVLSSCNCDYGCPCEFMAPPTRGYCEGMEAKEITAGYFGGVRLDGLRVVSLFAWPGAVHEGGGSAQMFIDERATPEQYEALATIFGGGEQEPYTANNIYGSTIEHDFGVASARIEFEWDMARRRGRFEIDGLCRAVYEPIRNPVTDKEHRALIKLPEGFEFREAEVASTDFWSSTALKLQHHRGYGFLTFSSQGPYGVIEDGSYPLQAD